ncbi:hypothetical protein KPH14_009872 [Odynerus spinipes]|uniref:Galactosylgalactosylxylosylprotein 3-beta-glucuronosyltransferase n=1 Tax=Odynerus spinipes TaxID=1348599 RepID=A0AAD9RVY5_9HYME|nr:hypothetical protein KPH14_009872 [Odynerus spinipes]
MQGVILVGYVAYTYCKNILVLLTISLIAAQYFTYYQELYKWQELRKELESLITAGRDTDDMLHNQMMLIRQRINDINEKGQRISHEKPTIYAITPTFTRPVQKAELTRLSQTFKHVVNFHWIVVEDAPEKTRLVMRLLDESGLIHTHLAAATPPNYKLGKNDPNWKKPRGVEQRNAALRWLRKNLKSSDNGIVFFADDDNTYSVKLFQEMEKIRRVGVWPVGLVGGLMVEKPICNNATNKSGYQESEILRQIVTREELEPLADCCTKVYVWHTRTEPPRLDVEQLLIKKGKRSNVGIEV